MELIRTRLKLAPSLDAPLGRVIASWARTGGARASLASGGRTAFGTNGYRMVGMTKLWSSTTPPLGQRWVTVLVRV